MAEFEKRVTRKVRTEYRLRTPVHASEVYKALRVADTDVKDHVDRFPRAPQPEIFMASDDEHVVIYWEHEQASSVSSVSHSGVGGGSMVPGR